MGRRRYLPIKDHPYYSDIYDRLRMDSIILNASTRSKSFSHAGDYSDATFLKGLILEWEGNENGKFFVPDANAFRTARIPGIKEQLEEINAKFELLKKQQVSEGKHSPENMPKDLNEKRLQLEAALDVHQEEVDYINECLAKVETEEQVRNNGQVLKGGPQGRSRIQDGMLVALDGQRVSLNDKGTLVIDDSRSPYHGLATADYFAHVVQPWTKACAKNAKELKRRAQEAGTPLYNMTRGALQGTTGTPWPVFPKGCKNHFQAKETVSNGKRDRKN